MSQNYTLRGQHRDTFRLVPVGSTEPGDYIHVPTNSTGYANFEADPQNYYVYCRPAYTGEFVLLSSTVAESLLYLRVQNPAITADGVYELSEPTLYLSVNFQSEFGNLPYVRDSEEIQITVNVTVGGAPAYELTSNPVVNLYKPGAPSTIIATATYDAGSWSASAPHIYHYTFEFTTALPEDIYYFKAYAAAESLTSPDYPDDPNVLTFTLDYTPPTLDITNVFLSSASATLGSAGSTSSASVFISVPEAAITDAKSGPGRLYLQPFLENNPVDELDNPLNEGIRYVGPTGSCDNGSSTTQYDCEVTSGDDWTADADPEYVFHDYYLTGHCTGADTTSTSEADCVNAGLNGGAGDWHNPWTPSDFNPELQINLVNDNSDNDLVSDIQNYDGNGTFRLKAPLVIGNYTLGDLYPYKIFKYAFDEVTIRDSWPINFLLSGNTIQNVLLTQDLPSGFVVNLDGNRYGFLVTAADKATNTVVEMNDMLSPFILFDTIVELAPMISWQFTDGILSTANLAFTNENGWYNAGTESVGGACIDYSWYCEADQTTYQYTSSGQNDCDNNCTSTPCIVSTANITSTYPTQPLCEAATNATNGIVWIPNELVLQVTVTNATTGSEGALLTAQYSWDGINWYSLGSADQVPGTVSQFFYNDLRQGANQLFLRGMNSDGNVVGNVFSIEYKWDKYPPIWDDPGAIGTCDNGSSLTQYDCETVNSANWESFATGGFNRAFIQWSTSPLDYGNDASHSNPGVYGADDGTPSNIEKINIYRSEINGPNATDWEQINLDPTTYGLVEVGSVLLGTNFFLDTQFHNVDYSNNSLPPFYYWGVPQDKAGNLMVGQCRDTGVAKPFATESSCVAAGFGWTNTVPMLTTEDGVEVEPLVSADVSGALGITQEIDDDTIKVHHDIAVPIEALSISPGYLNDIKGINKIEHSVGGADGSFNNLWRVSSLGEERIVLYAPLDTAAEAVGQTIVITNKSIEDLGWEHFLPNPTATISISLENRLAQLRVAWCEDASGNKVDTNGSYTECIQQDNIEDEFTEGAIAFLAAAATTTAFDAPSTYVAGSYTITSLSVDGVAQDIAIGSMEDTGEVIITDAVDGNGGLVGDGNYIVIVEYTYNITAEHAWKNIKLGLHVSQFEEIQGHTTISYVESLNLATVIQGVPGTTSLPTVLADEHIAVDFGYLIESLTKHTLNFTPVQTSYFWRATFNTTIPAASCSNVSYTEEETCNDNYKTWINEVDQDSIHFDSILAADLIVGGTLRLETGLSVWSGSFVDGEPTGTGLTMDELGLRMFKNSDTTVDLSATTGSFTFGSGVNQLTFNADTGQLSLLGTLTQVNSDSGVTDVEFQGEWSEHGPGGDQSNPTDYEYGHLVFDINEDYWAWINNTDGNTAYSPLDDGVNWILYASSDISGSTAQDLFLTAESQVFIRASNSDTITSPELIEVTSNGQNIDDPIRWTAEGTFFGTGTDISSEIPNVTMSVEATVPFGKIQLGGGEVFPPGTYGAGDNFNNDFEFSVYPAKGHCDDPLELTYSDCIAAAGTWTVDKTYDTFKFSSGSNLSSSWIIVEVLSSNQAIVLSSDLNTPVADTEPGKFTTKIRPIILYTDSTGTEYTPGTDALTNSSVFVYSNIMQTGRSPGVPAENVLDILQNAVIRADVIETNPASGVETTQYFDSSTLHTLQEGSGAYSVLLSNPAHIEFVNEFGTGGDWDDSLTSITLFLGIEQRKAVCVVKSITTGWVQAAVGVTNQPTEGNYDGIPVFTFNGEVSDENTGVLILTVYDVDLLITEEADLATYDYTADPLGCLVSDAAFTVTKAFSGSANKSASLVPSSNTYTLDPNTNQIVGPVINQIKAIDLVLLDSNINISSLQFTLSGSDIVTFVVEGPGGGAFDADTEVDAIYDYNNNFEVISNNPWTVRIFLAGDQNYGLSSNLQVDVIVNTLEAFPDGNHSAQYQDSVSLIQLIAGENTIAGVLSNESFTVPTDYTGDIAGLGDAGGVFLVYKGINSLNNSGDVFFEAIGAWYGRCWHEYELAGMADLTIDKFTNLEIAPNQTKTVRWSTLDTGSRITAGGSTFFDIDPGDNFVTWVTTWFKVEEDFSVTDVVFKGDNEHILYINNVEIASAAAANAPGDVSYSYSFSTGDGYDYPGGILGAGAWYKIDMLYSEGGGGDYVELGWNPSNPPAGLIESGSGGVVVTIDNSSGEYLVPYFLEPWATSATQWLRSSFMQEGTTAFPQIELVANGSFTDTSAWTVPEATQEITNDQLVYTEATTGSGVSQPLLTEEGVEYVYSIDIAAYTGGNIILHFYGGAIEQDISLNLASTYLSGTQTYSSTFTAFGNFGINLMQDGSPTTCTIDNVSVKQVGAILEKQYTISKAIEGAPGTYVELRYWIGQYTDFDALETYMRLDEGVMWPPDNPGATDLDAWVPDLPNTNVPGFTTWITTKVYRVDGTTPENSTWAAPVVFSSQPLDPTIYYIKPLNGTSLHNNLAADGSGSLTVQGMRQNQTEGDLPLPTDTIYHFSSDPSGSPEVTVDGDFKASFTPDDITGSLTLYLFNDQGAVLDTITLVDIADGMPAGYVTAETLVFTQTTEGAWEPGGSIPVTASFLLADLTLVHSTGTINVDQDGLINTEIAFDNTDEISNTDSGTSNSKTLTLTFTHDETQMAVSETFYAVSRGEQGEEGIQGLTGPSVVYTGGWDANREQYFAIEGDVADVGGGLTEIVRFDYTNVSASKEYHGQHGSYYICALTHYVDDNGNPRYPADSSGILSGVWTEFGAQFDSVATGLLLAETVIGNEIFGNTLSLTDSFELQSPTGVCINVGAMDIDDYDTTGNLADYIDDTTNSAMRGHWMAANAEGRNYPAAVWDAENDGEGQDGMTPPGGIGTEINIYINDDTGIAGGFPAVGCLAVYKEDFDGVDSSFVLDELDVGTIIQVLPTSGNAISTHGGDPFYYKVVDKGAYPSCSLNPIASCNVYQIDVEYLDELPNGTLSNTDTTSPATSANIHFTLALASAYQIQGACEAVGGTWQNQNNKIAISSAGIDAYNASGDRTVHISADDGDFIFGNVDTQQYLSYSAGALTIRGTLIVQGQALDQQIRTIDLASSSNVFLFGQCVINWAGNLDLYPGSVNIPSETWTFQGDSGPVLIILSLTDPENGYEVQLNGQVLGETPHWNMHEGAEDDNERLVPLYFEFYSNTSNSGQNTVGLYNTGGDGVDLRSFQVYTQPSSTSVTISSTLANLSECEAENGCFSWFAEKSGGVAYPGNDDTDITLTSADTPDSATLSLENFMGSTTGALLSSSVQIVLQAAPASSEYNIYDSYTITRLLPGAPGEQSVVALLSNEAHSVSGAFSGAITLDPPAEGIIQVFDGITNVTDLATFTHDTVVQGLGDLNETADSPIGGQPAGYYQITQVDAGANFTTIPMTISYGGVTLQKTFSVSASREGDVGDSAELISLTASSQFFALTGVSVGNHTGIVVPGDITISATVQNVPTGLTWTVDPPTENTQGIGGVPYFTIANEDFTNVPTKVTLTGTTTTGATISDEVTIIYVEEGSSAIGSFLTNESHTVPAYSDGSSPDCSGANGSFTVMQGIEDVSDQLTYSVEAGDIGCTFSNTNDYACTCAGWAAGSSTNVVQLRATMPSGAVIDKLFTLSKSVQGGAAVTWSIVGPSIIEYNPNNTTYTPSPAVWKSYKTIGSAAPVQTAVDWTVDVGQSGSGFNGTDELVFTPTTQDTVTVTIKVAGEVLDQEIIPVLDSSSDAWTIDLSNDNITVPETSYGVYDISLAKSQVKLYQGATEMTTVGPLYLITTSETAGDWQWSATESGSYADITGGTTTLVSGDWVKLKNYNTFPAALVLSHHSGVAATVTVSNAEMGVLGTPAETYSISSTADVVVYNPNAGTYTPSSGALTVSATRKVGDDAPAPFSGYWSIDGGSNWSGAASSKLFNVTTATTVLLSTTNTGGNTDGVVDSETIPVLDSSSDAWTVNLSNDNVTVPETDYDIYDVTLAKSQVKLYQGATEITTAGYLTLTPAVGNWQVDFLSNDTWANMSVGVDTAASSGASVRLQNDDVLPASLLVSHTASGTSATMTVSGADKGTEGVSGVSGQMGYSQAYLYDNLDQNSGVATSTGSYKFAETFINDSEYVNSDFVNGEFATAGAMLLNELDKNSGNHTNYYLSLKTDDLFSFYISDGLWYTYKLNAAPTVIGVSPYDRIQFDLTFLNSNTIDDPSEPPLGYGAGDQVVQMRFAPPIASIDGINSATVMLYQRKSTQPSIASIAITYTFAGGTITGTLDSWEASLPAFSSVPLWATSALASSDSATDSLSGAGDWADAIQINADGAPAETYDIVNTYGDVVVHDPNAGTYTPSTIIVTALKYTGGTPASFTAGYWSTDGGATWSAASNSHTINNITASFTILLSTTNNGGDITGVVDSEAIAVLDSSSDAWTISLSNDNITVGETSYGVYDISLAKSQVKLYQGATEITTASLIETNEVAGPWQWSTTGSSGWNNITGSTTIKSGDYVRLNGYASLPASLILSHTSSGVSSTVSVSSAEMGIEGIGIDAESYAISSTADVVVYDPNSSTYTPGSGALTVSATKKVGTAAPVAFSGHWSIDGGTTWSGAASSKAYNVTTATTVLLSTTSVNGNTDGVVDSETIPVLDSSSDTWIIDLSNDNVTVPEISAGTWNITYAKSQVRLYQGGAEVTTADAMATDEIAGGWQFGDTESGDYHNIADDGTTTLTSGQWVRKKCGTGTVASCTSVALPASLKITHISSSVAATMTVSEAAMGTSPPAGYQMAHLVIYQRNSSTSEPTNAIPGAGAVTYTFDGGSMTGTMTGWTVAPPSTSGTVLWYTTATAFAQTTDATDSVTWAAAQILSEDGASITGDQGLRGTEHAHVVNTVNGDEASWSSTACTAAMSDDKCIINDVCTTSNETFTTPWSVTYHYTGAVDGDGYGTACNDNAGWAALAQVIDGSLLVAGSITSDSIMTGTIVATDIKGDTITADQCEMETLIADTCKIANFRVSGDQLEGGSNNNIIINASSNPYILIKD